MIGNEQQLIDQYDRMKDDLEPMPYPNPRPEPNGFGGDWEQVEHFEPELIEQLYAKPKTEEK